MAAMAERQALEAAEAAERANNMNMTVDTAPPAQRPQRLRETMATTALKTSPVERRLSFSVGPCETPFATGPAQPVLALVEEQASGTL